ncbi:hypothetical protein [Candidatus Vidania fulgoroideorum]
MRFNIEKEFNKNFKEIKLGPYNKACINYFAHFLRIIIFKITEGFSINKINFSNQFLGNYSYNSGFKEDFCKIILNLKGIVLKINKKEDIINFTKKGPFIFYAGDLISESCKILNPEKKIFTFNKEEFVKIKLFINKGTGYKFREEILDSENNLVIDSYYCPIKRIYYSCKKNFINIGIKTNGVISPEKTLKKTLKFLIKNFSHET